MQLGCGFVTARKEWAHVISHLYASVNDSDNAFVSGHQYNGMAAEQFLCKAHPWYSLRSTIRPPCCLYMTDWSHDSKFFRP
jgi:hypothetical protein